MKKILIFLTLFSFSATFSAERNKNKSSGLTIQEASMILRHYGFELLLPTKEQISEPEEIFQEKRQLSKLNKNHEVYVPQKNYAEPSHYESGIAYLKRRALRKSKDYQNY